jgi:hypothetical protein
MSPIAPFGDTAQGLKADSRFITSRIRSGSTPSRRDAVCTSQSTCGGGSRIARKRWREPKYPGSGLPEERFRAAAFLTLNGCLLTLNGDLHTSHGGRLPENRSLHPLPHGRRLLRRQERDKVTILGSL